MKKLNAPAVLNKVKFEKFKVSNEEVIELYRVPTTKGCLEIVRLKKGNYPPHIHDKANAKLYILSGSGKLFLNKKKKDYREGDIINIPKGISHGFSVRKATIMLSIQSKQILNKETEKIDLRYKK